MLLSYLCLLALRKGLSFHLFIPNLERKVGFPVFREMAVVGLGPGWSLCRLTSCLSASLLLSADPSLAICLQPLASFPSVLSGHLSLSYSPGPMSFFFSSNTFLIMSYNHEALPGS